MTWRSPQAFQRFLDLLKAVASKLEVEHITIAAELEEREGTLPAQITACLAGAACNSVPHEEFKAQTPNARAVVRTGECTPYANVIVSSGVTF